MTPVRNLGVPLLPEMSLFLAAGALQRGKQPSKGEGVGGSMIARDPWHGCVATELQVTTQLLQLHPL